MLKLRRVRRTNNKSRLKLKILKQLLSFNLDSIFKDMYSDTVTGCLNRKAFEESDFNSLVLVDMDSLKYINDNFGHIKGDQCLKELGELLIKNFGEDRVFRIGGDEFVVISQDLKEWNFLQSVKSLQDSNCTFSFGFGTSLKLADKDLNDNKANREQEGLRVGRGERPTWTNSL